MPTKSTSMYAVKIEVCEIIIVPDEKLSLCAFAKSLQKAKGYVS